MIKKTAKIQETTIAPINPFMTAINGIRALFAGAATIGIFLIIVALAQVTLSSSSPTSNGSKSSQEEFNAIRDQIIATPVQELIIGGIILFVVLAVALAFAALVHGIQSYTALQISKGKRAYLNETANEVIRHFGPYFILYVWMNIKIFLWTLLFIIPGINARFRYSFAGMLFFENKKFRHEHAIKESSRLAKGGVMTLFASNFLFNMITLFWIDTVVTPAANSQLYHVYKSLDSRKQAKPGVHALSWLTLALPFIIIFALFMISILIFGFLAMTNGGFSRGK